ncbi:4-amino-4-deoxychorismate lyase [Schizosaccharomyces cryophilus OY26]|uniref:4-amino-4-deoxychorismate lyase n=1 Tax=Schizosaccharomyces cryophilus (strain OY26 / ATCC MYA-4695 / CBS 11777 / NBRC 106824 / NRRL Y48691) TaxID=653667 RepID=S9W2V1_SCHCR|nr:4-amino-4-deoxychorismate lyase [Schizosaccharomyces cryophilus OY26]EPY52879.1 4-amino-4-deoxychorismate lyase [Schizosaccharomyces cryophilus OY26]
MNLFETTLYANGEIFLLSEHLGRMKHSASTLGYYWPGEEAVKEKLLHATETLDQARLRWELSKDGKIHVKAVPVAVSNEQPLYTVFLDTQPSDTQNNVTCINKTTSRDIYSYAVQRTGIEYAKHQDVLLHNSSGFVTEGTIFNVAFERHNQWVTPNLKHGLLPGTMRQHLLSTGYIVQDKQNELRKESLKNGEQILLFNSFRKICKGVLIIKP